MDKDRRTRVKTYTQFLECPPCSLHPCCETHCFIWKDEFEEEIGGHDMKRIFESHDMSWRNNVIFLPWDVPSKTLAWGSASSVCLEERKSSYQPLQWRIGRSGKINISHLRGRVKNEQPIVAYRQCYIDAMIDGNDILTSPNVPEEALNDVNARVPYQFVVSLRKRLKKYNDR